MEMGCILDEPTADAPFPPLPVAASVIDRLPGHLEDLAERARDYVEAASSANTRRAYASDWRHFSSWCRRQGVEMFPPDPQVVGLYITAQASGTATCGKKPTSVSTIERRLRLGHAMPLPGRLLLLATIQLGPEQRHHHRPGREFPSLARSIRLRR